MKTNTYPLAVPSDLLKDLRKVARLTGLSVVDTVTGETMLLRAVIEETESEIAVITLYKTSKLKKYLPEETT